MLFYEQLCTRRNKVHFPRFDQKRSIIVRSLPQRNALGQSAHNSRGILSRSSGGKKKCHARAFAKPFRNYTRNWGVFQFLTNRSTDTTLKITLIWEQSEFAGLLTTINVIFFVVVLWYRLQFREFHYYCDSSSVRVTMARSSVIAFLVYLLAGYPANGGKETWTHCEKDESQSLYNFTTKYLNGKAVSLEKYRGDVSLVLNVATYWGYTFQYLHLNALMKEFSTGKYKCGFSVLAFPCNQFMYQEPGTNSKEILNGLKCVRPGNGFQPHFPLFQKIQVNGKDEDQIYTFLKVINWLFLGLNVAHN